MTEAFVLKTGMYKQIGMVHIPKMTDQNSRGLFQISRKKFEFGYLTK